MKKMLQILLFFPLIMTTSLIFSAALNNVIEDKYENEEIAKLVEPSPENSYSGTMRTESSRTPRPESRVLLYAKSPIPKVKSMARCVICLDSLQATDATTTTGKDVFQCSPDHLFHKACLAKWLNHNPHGGCPLCRAGHTTVDETANDHLTNYISSEVSAGDVLSIAIEMNHMAVVHTLLDDGVSPNILDSFGQTPLIVAINNKRIPIIKLLIEKGAHYIPGSINPLIPAVTRFYKPEEMDILQLIAQHIPETVNTPTNDWYPITLAALYGNINAVKTLHQLHAHLNVTTDINTTPLSLAATRGHTDVVRYLLENKADTTIPDIDGWTPLDRASQMGHLEIVKMLLGMA